MREAFALQKLLTFLSRKNIGVFEILKFDINKTLTNDVIGFEQTGPGLLFFRYWHFGKTGLVNRK